MNNHAILERITGLCHPSRANRLTGANLPAGCAEPDTLTHTAHGYVGTGEFMQQAGLDDTWPIPVEWPAGKMVFSEVSA